MDGECVGIELLSKSGSVFNLIFFWFALRWYWCAFDSFSVAKSVVSLINEKRVVVTM
jgi:hypothetical protein